MRNDLVGFPIITEFSGTSCLITAPIPVKQSLPTVTPPMGYGPQGSVLIGEVAGAYGKGRRMVQTLANSLHSPSSTKGETLLTPCDRIYDRVSQEVKKGEAVPCGDRASWIPGWTTLIGGNLKDYVSSSFLF